MRTEHPSSEARPQGGTFATTHWSLVLAAGGKDTPESDAALEQLCRSYWCPLYAFARRQGHSPEDSEDLLQGFFARFLAKNSLAKVDPVKGRFRSFLLAAFRNYMANEWDKAHTVQRGGRLEFLSLESQAAESRYWEEPASELTAEKLYEQRWVGVLLERVMARLQHDFEASAKSPPFAALKHFLIGDSRANSYARVAAAHGLSEAALKMRVHRLRLRYQRLLREEIAQTVGRAEEVEDEIRYLFAALSG